MIVGDEFIVDAFECPGARINGIDPLREACDCLVRELGLHVVGTPQWHQFAAPGGVTGMYLLTESHLTCHTFPEWGLATFNLYCCRPRADWPWSQRLGELLGARQVVIRRIARGRTGARCDDQADVEPEFALIESKGGAT